MPTTLDATGLTISTPQEIVDALTVGMRAIYGPDINVEPNSPDGQLINLYAQVAADVLEQVKQVYTSFDPDKAIGVSLNSRCAINGVIRKAGTYTTQAITVVVNQSLTLNGVDTVPDLPFTIQDATGNKYVLASTVALTAGTTTQNFRALNLGGVSSLPNTITATVTKQLGVVSVNNPTGYTTLGTNEQTDYSLRILRQKSVSLPSKGYLEGLIGGLLNVPGVTQAVVYENVTGTTDGNGIPGHSIWVIAENGDSAAIAEAIYVKRNAGCGMKGGVTVNVLQVDGSYCAIKFDRPTAQNLYIRFDVDPVTGSVDDNYIRQQLLLRLAYSINQAADVTTISSLVREISGNAYVSDLGVSDDGTTWVNILSPNAINKQWAIASTRIKVNGVYGV